MAMELQQERERAVVLAQALEHERARAVALAQQQQASPSAQQPPPQDVVRKAPSEQEKLLLVQCSACISEMSKILQDDTWSVKFNALKDRLADLNQRMETEITLLRGAVKASTDAVTTSAGAGVGVGVGVAGGGAPHKALQDLLEVVRRREGVWQQRCELEKAKLVSTP
eukprot:TRINITY_DN353_c0_g2_i2.p1 TRINITY_DN353_c0_g2~~TRINITY_DN353_c0_g2_i2.p1  ORF type:complete len:184 (+),score=67.82 TRINITY_DN353_c0_g2_i2:47-553(+)